MAEAALNPAPKNTENTALAQHARRLRRAGLLPAQSPADSLPSPCVAVCRLDEGSGWCKGCFRSADEIRAWVMASPALQWEIWQKALARAGLTQD